MTRIFKALAIVFFLAAVWLIPAGEASAHRYYHHHHHYYHHHHYRHNHHYHHHHWH